MPSHRWKEHVGVLIGAGASDATAEGPPPFRVLECEPCGFRHAVPLPSIAQLVEVYRHDYYVTHKPTYLERSHADRAWWRRVHAERFDLFERELPNARRRVLDVGSGPGLFLALGAERGWSTLGIEPSHRAAAHARGLGLEVLEEFLTPELADRIGRRFDVVHLAEVLEHVPDPLEHLELCHSLLDPGGLLSVSVPNDFSPFQVALQRACAAPTWWVAPPHHLNYFDFDSLSGLFERAGFELVHRTTSFPIDLFLLMGEDYVGDDVLGRACHARRMRFEENLGRAGMEPLRRRLYESLAGLGLGRHVVLTGRRR